MTCKVNLESGCITAKHCLTIKSIRTWCLDKILNGLKGNILRHGMSLTATLMLCMYLWVRFSEYSYLLSILITSIDCPELMVVSTNLSSMTK